MNELLETLRLVGDQRWMISYSDGNHTYRIGDTTVGDFYYFNQGLQGSIAHLHSLQACRPTIITIDVISTILIDELGIPLTRQDLFIYYKRIQWN